MFRKSIPFISITLAVSLILPMVSDQGWSMSLWIDTFFLCSLLLLIVGGTFIVIEGGFFNAFTHSFKRFFTVISKKEQVLREVEGRREWIPYKRSYRFTYPVLIAGMILFLCSLLISIIYFYV
jgi:hypothetical protein